MSRIHFFGGGRTNPAAAEGAGVIAERASDGGRSVVSADRFRKESILNDLAKRYFRLSRREIGYLRFILESYDGLAFVRTLDPREALVEIAFPISRRQDAGRLLEALAEECAMVETAAPPSGRYPAL
jgi:hypothetical protein